MSGKFPKELFKRVPRHSGALFIILFLSLFASVYAQETTVLPPDVRLVIDVSGSMKRNDPNNLRQPAIELLVQLLPENSKAGVWTFGKWVNMLVPHRDVNLQWREAAQQESGSINSVGLFTNIGEALEKAAYDINNQASTNQASTNQESTHRKSIILLTDGMVDIDKDAERNRKEWRRIVDEVLPRLKEAGFTIHTIALSDNADSNLLGKLSLSTDGIAEVAHTADDLMKIFLKAFDAAAPAEQVPLDDNRFVIDSSIEEFTALIFRKNADETTELHGPDGSASHASSPAEGVSWHSTDSYDLITVSQPLEGEWQVKADMAPESRITVVSNLNLRVVPIPNNVYKGQHVDLKFALVEDGKVITRSEFLSLMQIDASLDAGADENDLRSVWSENLSRKPAPENGNYQTVLPDFDRNGIYEVNILVDGKSFQRTFTHRMTVRQPFAAEINEQFKDGKLDYLLTIKSFGNDVEVLKTEVHASVSTPGGNRKFIPLALTDMDTWRGTFVPDMEGEYVAEVRVKGKTKQGEDFDFVLESLRIYYSQEAGISEKPESFFPEPQAEPEAEAEAEAQPIVAPTIESKPEPKPESKPEPKVTAKKGLPDWILYSALGIGNLILFTLGFFIYKTLTRRESDDDVLAEFSDKAIAENASQSRSEPVKQEAAAPPQPAEDLDDEPPMEDLEPAMEDLSELMNSEPAMEEIELDKSVDTAAASDDLDDLDQMAVAEPEPDENDDMVDEMLKAQGLDLAGDELDDAISSLIDDMEADSGDDKEK